jgi:hypothetical protein
MGDGRGPEPTARIPAGSIVNHLGAPVANGRSGHGDGVTLGIEGCGQFHVPVSGGCWPNWRECHGLVRTASSSRRLTQPCAKWAYCTYDYGVQATATISGPHRGHNRQTAQHLSMRRRAGYNR